MKGGLSRKRRFVPEPQRSESAGDRGFTLIELLVVCVVLPLVVGAISVGIISVFELQGGVSNRMSGSGDAQVLSSTFVGDVQSATAVTAQSTPLQCGTTGTHELGLQQGTNQPTISYATVQRGSTYSLVRYRCLSGNTTTPVSSTVVSHDAGTQVVVTCT